MLKEYGYKIYRTRPNSRVLILILMEHAQRACVTHKSIGAALLVLILILMEHAQRVLYNAIK